MKRIFIVLATIAFAGCGSKPKPDEIVSMDKLPAVVREAAEKALPDVKFQHAVKIQVDGKTAYEVRGKSQKGKIREAEVSETGELLETE
jgi:hypothetical protein